MSTVVAQADLHSAIAVLVGLMGRTVHFITSTFAAARQEGSLPAHSQLGAVAAFSCLLSMSALSSMPEHWLCPVSLLCTPAGTPPASSTTDMGARHCSFIRSSFKCFKPLLRSKQPAKCSTRNGNVKTKIVVKSGSQYFFRRRVENLGVMSVHTDVFPQTLPSSSQKLYPNKL